MGKPAARVGDMHMCPMVIPSVPPVPHIGGPITGPGCPTVLIGGMPAAVLSDMCVCTGPPDSIILGSSGVLIGGKPAARMGDQTAHGGVIVQGCPTVLIGEVSGGSASQVSVTPSSVTLMAQLESKTQNKESLKKEAVSLKFKEAAANGTPLIKVCPKC